MLRSGLRIRDLEQLLQMVSIEHLNDKQLLTAAMFEEALSQHAKRKALTRYLRKQRQMKHLTGGLADWDQLNALSNTLTKHELQIQKLQQAQLPSLMFNQAAAASQLGQLLGSSLSPQPCTYVQQTAVSVQRSGSTTPKLTYYGDIYTSSGTTSSAVAAHLAASGVSAIPISNQVGAPSLAAPQPGQSVTTTNRKLPPMPPNAASSTGHLKAGTVPSPYGSPNLSASSPGQQLTVSTNQLEPATSPSKSHLISPKRYPTTITTSNLQSTLQSNLQSTLDSKSAYQPYDDYLDGDQMMILEEDEDELLADELTYQDDDELLYEEQESSWQQPTSSKKRVLDAKQAMISYGSRRLPQINQLNSSAPRPHRKLPHITDT